MTLVVATRNGENIHVFSDSRLTFERHQTVDIGVKLFSVPVRIESAIDSENGRSQILFTGEYGLAFAGSALNAHITTMLLADLLSRLQPLPDFRPSFETICEAMRGFAETIGKELCQYLRDRGLVEFLMLGHSPDSGQLSAARFSLITSNVGVKCQCKPVLMSEGDIEILGGRVGQSAFRAVLGKQPYTRSAMLAAMDTVIGDQNCAEVGGDVQYGEFMGTQFRVFGFIRQSMKGPDLAISYRVRGFDLNVELERLHQLGLHPRYPFVQGPDLPDDVVDQEVRKYLFSLT